MNQKKLNIQPKQYQNSDIVDNTETEKIDITHPDNIDSFNDILDDEPIKKERKKKTKEFYVGEKEFEDEMRQYYTTNIITAKLADMIRKMINGLAHRPNFINYTFRDEASGDALVNIMAALHKKKFRFAEGKKPFAYFNAIAWNCWRNRIKREAKQRNALAAFQDECYNDMLGHNNPNSTNSHHEE